MYKVEQDKLLTERELEVLVCIYKGFSNSKISGELCITISTVKAHISNILHKMGAKSRIDVLLMLIGQKDIKNKDVKQQIISYIKK